MMTKAGFFRHQDWLKEADAAALATVPQPGRHAAGPAATIITFDEFSGDLGYGPLPTGYGGNLTWSGFLWSDAPSSEAEYGPDNGYVTGVVSGLNAAFAGGSGTITSGGADFTLSSLYLTAAWRDDLRVQMIGYDDGVETFRRTVRVDNDGPTLVNLRFADVDTVTFTSSGGTPAEDGPDGSQFVIDDVTLTARVGSISGTVFDDLNGDGIQDPGEFGLRGRTVFLDANGNSVLDDGELSARSRADGSYTIKGVPFGDYDIVEVVPKGWHATYPFVEGGSYTQAETVNKFVNIAPRGGTQVFNEPDDGFSFLEASRGFTFYGQTYIDIYISVNGYIAFGAQPEKGFANQDMPNSLSPNAVIAPLWDDFILGDTGKVYALDDDLKGRLIIEWKDVQRYNDPSGAKYTFEAILYDDGTIRFAYKDVPPGATATIGVENESGTVATQVSYNEVVDASTGYIFKPSDIEYGKTTIRVDSGDVLTGIDFGQTRNVPLAAFDADATADGHAGARWMLLDHAVAVDHDMTVHLV